MKEKLLVLAKACPIVSKKYKELVCVAGVTDNGDWRRVYPVPWECFWSTSKNCFRKKQWIEYELRKNEPSDHRNESRKIEHETIKLLKNEDYADIRKILEKKLTTIEELVRQGHKKVSLGVIKPEIIGFIEGEKQGLDKIMKKKEQKNLFMDDAVRIDPMTKKYSYVFKCGNPECKSHTMMCEDWELSELYRKCEQYRKAGNYKDENEVFEKVKQRFFNDMIKKKEIYFIVGTHYRFNSFMIVGVIYPKNTDKF